MGRLIDYLTRQLFNHRGQVSFLKTELTEKKDRDARHSVHAGSVDDALKANKLEVAKLRQTSTTLERRLSVQKSERVKSRDVLRDMQERQHEILKEQELRFAEIERSRTGEIERANGEAERVRRECGAEISDLGDQISILTERHTSEEAELRAKLSRLEESYDDDLSKMLNALETAHEDDTRDVEGDEAEEGGISSRDTESGDNGKIAAFCEKCGRASFPPGDGSNANGSSRVISPRGARESIENEVDQVIAEEDEEDEGTEYYFTIPSGA